MRLVLLSRFILATLATPRIALPFNAQVPPVARVGQSYDFAFAASTFIGATAYTLVDQPAWLNLDGRTLSGVPGSSGAITFGIRASDSIGFVVLHCTLVITNDEIRAVNDFSQQTQGSGRLSAPSTLALHPGEAFAFAFRDGTFVGDVRQRYSISSDRTPLPAWLGFDASKLAFFGVAPGDGTYPITLIASSVVGFAGAEIAFTIQVCRRCLYFQPQREAYTGGAMALLPQLRIDGAEVRREQISKTSLQGPPGLRLVDQGLAVTGTAVGSLATVTVQDIFGNVAIKTLVLGEQHVTNASNTITTSISLSSSPTATSAVVILDNVMVRVGEKLRKELPSDFAGSQVLFDPPQEWISYQDNVLAGMVPETMPMIVRVSVSSRNAVGIFRIELFNDTSAGNGYISPDRDKGHTRAVIGGVIGSLLALSIILVCLYKLRKRRETKQDTPPISAGRGSNDDSSSHGMIEARSNPPPQLNSEVLGDSIMTRLSTQSSLGSGEDAIRADRNIPVWSEESQQNVRHNYSAASRMDDPSIRLLPDLRSKASVDASDELEVQRENPVLPAIAIRSIVALPSHNQTTRTKTTSNSRSVSRPISRHAMGNRRSIRLVEPSTSTLASQPLAEARQSFIRNRASSGVPSPLFTTGSRDSRHGSLRAFPYEPRQGSSARYSRRIPKYSESSELEPSLRHPRRPLTASNAPSSPDPNELPRTVAIDGSDVDSGASDALDGEEDRDSLYTDTTSDITEHDMAQTLANELRKPRHLRNWVLPGEASPTPPPATPTGTIVMHHHDRGAQQYVPELAGSSVDSRKAARRKWGAKLGRDITGQITTPPVYRQRQQQQQQQQQHGSVTFSARSEDEDELEVIEPLGKRVAKAKVPGYWSGMGTGSISVTRQRNLPGSGQEQTTTAVEGGLAQGWRKQHSAADVSSSPSIAFL